MKKIIQYTHCPNDTELGKGNTHETYMLIGSDVSSDVSKIFPDSVEVCVLDSNSKESYTLKASVGNEYRVNQLGQLYRDHNVNAGDELIFTLIVREGNSKCFVRVCNYNRILLNVTNKGTLITNEDKLQLLGDVNSGDGITLRVDYNNASNEINVKFKKTEKKRTDSPILSNYYDVLINGEDIDNGKYLIDLSSMTLLNFVKSKFQEVSLAHEDVLNTFGNDDSSRHLENDIAEFITAHDNDVLDIEQLTKRAKQMFDDETIYANKNTRVQLFGIFYDKQIGTNSKQIGEAYMPDSSYHTEIMKGMHMGRFLRSKIARRQVSYISPIDLSAFSLFNKRLITAIQTKPFILLAGISGTGKSRIVRELARSCWPIDSLDYKNHKPTNFEMIPVKPNWHDSSDLIGYSSSIEHGKYIVGDFIKFIVKAWQNLNVPYFLCLDEMNLAPVEQYFAEFLSVLESRKLKDGRIVSDAILTADVFNNRESHLFESLGFDTDGLYSTESNSLKEQFRKEGLTLPPNLIVMGTVNMDETTYSFSRKVLDRAMTIEMNSMDYNGGLSKSSVNEFGHITPSVFFPRYVEGCDVYEDNKDVCDKVIGYLTEVNNCLDTQFRIAYRTRNEFLIYAVNYIASGGDIEHALDDMTSMKILSRIEGDTTKVTCLDNLLNIIKDKLPGDSISVEKVQNMKKRLSGGYTSYWD